MIAMAEYQTHIRLFAGTHNGLPKLRHHLSADRIPLIRAINSNHGYGAIHFIGDILFCHDDILSL